MTFISALRETFANTRNFHDVAQLSTRLFYSVRYKTAGPEIYRRAAMLVYASLLTSLFSFFYLILHVAWAMRLSTWSMGMMIGLFLLLPFLLRAGLPLSWAANGYLLTGSAGVFVCTVAQGYIDTSVISYFTALSVIPLLIANKRTAWVWAITGCALTILSGFLYAGRIGPENELPAGLRTFYVTNGLACLVLLFFWIVMVFQRNTDRARLEAEKQKQRSDELLRNILPEKTISELKQTGRTTARSYDLVTVLFADFKDFTILSEQMSAEDLVRGIDEYFEAFDLIVAKYDVEKIKTVGDAYICASGLPEVNKDNPCIIVGVGLEMLAAVAAIGDRRRNLGLHAFEIRIGVHSGPLVAGVVGIRKFAYDIWGDTVNTAARMQQCSDPGRINISGNTYRLVQHDYDCAYRGKIEAKNKGAIDMYFVAGTALPATAGTASER